MEVFRINILPQEEILKREAFKNSISCCEKCGTDLEFTYTDYKAFYNIVREEAQCPTCSTAVCRDHKVQ